MSDALLELMEEADCLVLPNDPGAFLIDAKGTPSSGSASCAADVDRWVFVYAHKDNEPIVLIDHADGAFDAPHTTTEHPFGVFIEPLPRTMGLERAIALLREAAFDEPFAAVSVFRRLFPLNSEPAYLFTFPRKPFVFVGIETGTVTQASDSGRTGPDSLTLDP